MSLRPQFSARVVLIFALASLGLIVSAAFAQPPQIGVSPSRFDIDLDQSDTTQSFRVFNYGDTPLSVKLSINNWDLDENGNVRILPPTEQSLDQWVVINPVRFEVAPNDTQLVRFAVRPRVKPTAGEHRAIIYLDRDDTDTKEQSTFRFGFRIGMAVYGNVGPLERVGVLHDIQADHEQALFDVSSLGNAHVRLLGDWVLWPAELYPRVIETSDLKREATPPGKEPELPQGALQVGELPNRPVLPGSRRNVRLAFQSTLEPGEYALQVIGTVGDTAIDQPLFFTVTDPDGLPQTITGGDRR